MSGLDRYTTEDALCYCHVHRATKLPIGTPKKILYSTMRSVRMPPGETIGEAKLLVVECKARSYVFRMPSDRACRLCADTLTARTISTSGRSSGGGRKSSR